MRSIVLMLLLSTIPAAAQTAEETWAQCKGADLKLRVPACTSVLVVSQDPMARLYAYYARGRGYLLSREYDKAIEDYSKAIEIPKDAKLNAKLYDDRGTAYLLKDEFDLAIADFTAAIGIDPTSADAYSHRATCNHQKRDDARALPDVEKAVELKSDIKYLSQRGVIYAQLRQKEKAIADFRAVLKIDPNHKTSLQELKRLGVEP